MTSHGYNTDGVGGLCLKGPCAVCGKSEATWRGDWPDRACGGES
jgi:hypothetical protein